MPNFIKTTACGLMQLKINTPSSLGNCYSSSFLGRCAGAFVNRGSLGHIEKSKPYSLERKDCASIVAYIVLRGTGARGHAACP